MSGTQEHDERDDGAAGRHNLFYARLGYLVVYFALASCAPYYSSLLNSKGMSPGWVGAVMALNPLSILFLLPPLAHLADTHNCAPRVLIVTGVLSCTSLLAATAIPMNLVALSLFMALHFGGICTFTAFFDQRVLSTFTASQKAEWGSTRCFGGIGWGVMAPIASTLVGVAGWWTVGVLYTVFYAASVACYLTLSPCLATAAANDGRSGGTGDTASAPTKSAVMPALVELIPGTMWPEESVDKEMGYSTSRRAHDTATGEQKGGEEAPQMTVRGPRIAEEEFVAVTKREVSFAHMIALICTRRRLLLVLLIQCIGGIGYTVITTYLFLFLATLHSPSWLYGVAVTMTVVVEIPLFWISERLHARLSDRQMMGMALLGWSLRVFGYALLPANAPWVVLLVEPLHGLSFGFLWLSGVHCITRAFPASFAGSGVGFLNAATFGVGPVLGNLLGGWVYTGVGPRALFGGGGVVMLALTAVYVCLDSAWEKNGDSLVIDESSSVEGLEKE